MSTQPSHTAQYIADHYTRGDLLQAIAAAVEASGKSTDTMTVDDLAPVDEFHFAGGRPRKTLSVSWASRRTIMFWMWDAVLAARPASLPSPAAAA